MKILVTGATGFIGRRACELLQTKGLQVTATGRDKAKAQYLAKLGIEFIPVELSSAKEVSSLSGHYDALVHCGGLSSPWGKADEFSQANVVGTENVVNFCHENKVGKLIFIEVFIKS